MKKKPGLFTYIEVDYAASKEEIQNLEEHVAGSTLNPAVAHLIAIIFNVASMEKLMLEYSVSISFFVYFNKIKFTKNYYLMFLFVLVGYTKNATW